MRDGFLVRWAQAELLTGPILEAEEDWSVSVPSATLPPELRMAQ